MMTLMKTMQRAYALMAVTATLTLCAAGQAPQHAKSRPVLLDASLTLTGERNITTVSGNGFWMAGAGADFAVSLHNGWGVAAQLDGGHKTNVGTTGTSFGKVSYMGGPRYTFVAGKLRQKPLRLFAEALGGGVYGVDGIFPAPGGAHYSATGYSMQFGGGADVDLHNGWGLRLLQLDYRRTGLPNGQDNVQNAFRIGFGLSLRK